MSKKDGMGSRCAVRSLLSDWHRCRRSRNWTATRGCVNALNKDAAKLAATQGKANAGCLKAAGKGKLPSGQSADECLIADAKGKVAKVAAKIAADYTDKCVADPPTFGVPGGTVAGHVSDVPVDQSLNLFADVFGASLTTAAIDCSRQGRLRSASRRSAKGTRSWRRRSSKSS